MFMVFTKKQLRVMALILLLTLIFFCAIIRISGTVVMSKSESYQRNWNGHFAGFQPAENGYSVLVDLDTMTLHLYEDSIEIKSWPVSGGSKENPSPTGNWVITDIGDWASGFGGSWIGLDVPWGKYGIHGTVEPWALGQFNISHGCIRMKNEDVAELKTYISVGVPIHIKHDNAPFRILQDGNIGSDVLLLQIMLSQLGYMDGSLTGTFGRKTFDALCEFESEQAEMSVDGIVDRETWDEIQEQWNNMD